MDGWSAVVFVVCCAGSRLCDGMITCSEEFCRLCVCVGVRMCVRECVCVCDLQTSKNKFPFTVDFLEPHLIRLSVQHSPISLISSSLPLIPFETAALKSVLK